MPLGGAKHAFGATLVVFTFVALWHDLSLRLLTWGWVISLFVVPEMVAKKLVPYDKVRLLPHPLHRSHSCSAADGSGRDGMEMG